MSVPGQYACQECDRKLAVIVSLQAEFVKYGIREADALMTTGQYSEAAEIYDRALQFLDTDQARANELGDLAAAAATEARSLPIQQRLARARKEERRYPDAEKMMRHVWTRAKELKEVMPIEEDAVRTAQIELCAILIEQAIDGKSNEAERLYREVWSRHRDYRTFEMLGEDHAWIIENGRLLARYLWRLWQREDAVFILRQVVSHCVEDPGVETNAMIRGLIEWLLDSPRDSEMLNNSRDANREEVKKIIREWIPARTAYNNPEVLESVIKIARAIDERGAHRISLPLWHQIHEEQKTLYGRGSDPAFDSGWKVATCYITLGEPDKAVALVKDLLHARDRANENSERMKMMRRFLYERIGRTYSMRRHSSGHSHKSGSNPMSRGDSGQNEEAIIEDADVAFPVPVRLTFLDNALRSIGGRRMP